MAFVFNVPVVFIETNIRRVIIHHFFKNTKRKISESELLFVIEKTIDKKNPREWYYALMDYGSWLGKNSERNPNEKSALYKKQPAFRGSHRELRGNILKYALAHKKSMTIKMCAKFFGYDEKMVRHAYSEMKKEGFFGR